MLVFVAVMSLVQQANASGSLNVLLGFKAMESNDRDPVHMQGEVGLMLDFKGQDGP